MNFIRVEQRGQVTTITLDRPEVMNAIHGPMHHELQQAFDAFDADVDQRVCVLTGAGERSFCAGSDLKAAAVAGTGKAGFPRNGYGGLAQRFDLSKPVIAAVNGVAVGGGFELALACDIVLAAEHASFGLTEPLVGAVAGGGGIQRLVKQIGLKAAMGLILSSRRISAAEGMRLGFVNEVVAREDLVSSTMRWCQQILAGAPFAIRASKAVAMAAVDTPSLADAIQGQEALAEMIVYRDSGETAEGITAFIDNRPTRWSRPD